MLYCTIFYSDFIYRLCGNNIGDERVCALIDESLVENKILGEGRLQSNLFVPLSVLNYRLQLSLFLSKYVILSLCGDSSSKYCDEFESVLYGYHIFFDK